MRLFIRIKDGQPVEHPIMEDNFRLAFPDIDIDNLTPEFANFIRTPITIPNPYVKNPTVSYQLVNGIYTDVFSWEQMNSEEIAAKQQYMRDGWAAMNGFASWILDEETCEFVAPIPKPDEINIYTWNESTTSWDLVTTTP